MVLYRTLKKAPYIAIFPREDRESILPQSINLKR